MNSEFRCVLTQCHYLLWSKYQGNFTLRSECARPRGTAKNPRAQILQASVGMLNAKFHDRQHKMKFIDWNIGINIILVSIANFPFHNNSVLLLKPNHLDFVTVCFVSTYYCLNICFKWAKMRKTISFNS